MPRKSNMEERKKALTPIVARAFAELGYRRATTSQLAFRCEVQENILYRLWSDKKAMFLDAIDHVYQLSESIWEDLIQGKKGKRSAAEQLLSYEAGHHGEFGLYRIIFAGLNESDDPDIRQALKGMYDKFHVFIKTRVKEHIEKRGGPDKPNSDLIAWAIIGLGSVANISRELELMTDNKRKVLFREIGQILLGDSN